MATDRALQHSSCAASGRSVSKSRHRSNWNCQSRNGRARVCSAKKKRDAIGWRALILRNVCVCAMMTSDRRRWLFECASVLEWAFKPISNSILFYGAYTRMLIIVIVYVCMLDFVFKVMWFNWCDMRYSLYVMAMRLRLILSVLHYIVQTCCDRDYLE